MLSSSKISSLATHKQIHV